MTIPHQPTPDPPAPGGIKPGTLFTLEYPQSLGVYATYVDAQRVVDYLADNKFAVQFLAIVGTDLRSVERVTGRKTWGSVLSTGAASGIWTGLLVGLMLWFFTPGVSWLTVVSVGLLIGITLGMLSAGIAFSMSHGRRDFNSVQQTIASRYEVIGEHTIAAQAREMIARMPGAPAPIA